VNETATSTGAAPLVARIAGLEASAVEPLASPRCAELATVVVATERELDEVRSQLVDRLYAEIHGAPAELRRLFLAVKRDSFNHRSISRHRNSSLWPSLHERIGPLAESVVALEQRLADEWDTLRGEFASEGGRQARYLCRLVLEEKGLLRGLALAGPSMVGDLRRFCKEPGRPVGSKQMKLAISLSRYVSRSALKLSPNSTLTRSALGSVERETPDSLRLLGSGWQERSLLRLRRIYVDQWRDLLLCHSAFRASLPIGLNESIQEIESGRFRWLRPGRWKRSVTGTDLHFVQDAFVNTRRENRPFRFAFNLLQAGPLSFLDLQHRLTGKTEHERRVMEAELDQLLDLGFLRFLLPWSEDEAHVELQLLRHLRTISQLEEIADFLDRLVELQQGYADAAEPERALPEMANLSAGLTRRLGELAGLDLNPVEDYRRGRFYEDVLLVRRTEAGSEDLVQVSRAAMERTAASTEPLVRLAFLYSHRHDFLHALAELASRQFPHQQTVGFLDLFSAAQPLWRQYDCFLAEATKDPDGWRSSFDPFGLTAVEELDRLRHSAWDGLGSCVTAVEHAEVLSGSALADLLTPVPLRYAPLVGVCLFLQPLDDYGERWFLNRMHEGVGRYGSRFTSTMSPSTRARYTDYLASRTPFEIDGEPLELLDLLCSQGDTLNVHAVQTPWVLDIHGNGPHSSCARRLRLRDLRVELAGPHRLPWLMDADGQRFLPVHLGGASHAFMPTIVKFLSLFGPGEFRSVWPLRRLQHEGEGEVLKRLMIDSVVFGRKRWSFPLRSIDKRLAAPDPEAYVALQDWRLRQGIPERVFLLQRIPHRVLADRFKPQYLDLTSPLSPSILRTAIENGNGSVSFEEMLPDPEAFPRDRDGRHWGVELLLDTLALRPQRYNAGSNKEIPLRTLGAIPTLPPEPATAHL
jgi:hypothetical protein